MHKGKLEGSHERLSWSVPDALSSAVRSAGFVSPWSQALPGWSLATGSRTRTPPRFVLEIAHRVPQL